MATKSGSVVMSNSTAAYIQTWATWLSSGISDAGWVQTSDTGQCNTGTLGVPGAIQTPVGYQIFRMTDSLQATAPVFLKIEFGSGAAINTPAIWLTVAKGSDGAGNLTGILLPRTQFGQTSITAPQPCYLSGATNRLSLAMWAANTSYSVVFVIERTHDAVGADTGVGLTVLLAPGSSKSSAYLPFSGTLPPVYTNWNVASPPSGSGALSPNVYFYPVRCWAPGETFPALGALAYVAGDVATGGTYSIQGFDGNSRTYLPLGSGSAVVGYGGNNHIAIRYE